MFSLHFNISCVMNEIYNFETWFFLTVYLLCVSLEVKGISTAISWHFKQSEFVSYDANINKRTFFFWNSAWKRLMIRICRMFILCLKISLWFFWKCDTSKIWCVHNLITVLHKSKFPPLLAVILLFEKITHTKHMHILCHTKSNK